MYQLLILIRNGTQTQQWNTLLRPGTDGSFDTLAVMAAMVRKDVSSPGMIALEGALTRGCGSDVCAINKLFRYAQGIRFVRDPIGIERVADAGTTAAAGTGDCVDKSTLLATLLKIRGIVCQFLAMNFYGDALEHGFDHVMVQAQLPSGSWWSLDPTDEHAPVGWKPDAVQQVTYSI